MDYFQGVVTEYLRADRAMFVNTECCIQLHPGRNSDVSPGTHWFCDAVAVSFRAKTVHLCEVTYSKTLHGLLGRLTAWSTNWPALKTALIRDCSIPDGWHVAPWVFLPAHLRGLLEVKLGSLRVNEADPMPRPMVTDLEDVLPWKYRSWDRVADTSMS